MSGPARLALALALSLAAAAGASAQDAAQGAAPGGTASAAQAPAPPPPRDLGPVKDVDNENALARFGIVSFGSFPILLFYTDFSFDLGRYVVNGFDSNYAPWPFKSEYTESPTEAELLTRIGVAVGASLTVGAIDYFIRASKAKKAKLRRQALLEYSAEERAGAEKAPPPEPAPAPAP